MNIDTLIKNKGKVKQFNSKNIFSVKDLLHYMPRDYIDYRIPQI